MMKSCFRYMLVIFSFAALGCEAREDGRETPAVKEPENVSSTSNAMERGETKTPEAVVREYLEKRGLEVGYNPERKAIIAIGTQSVDIKDPSKELTEERRFEAFDAAYLRAVGKISEDISTSVEVVESSVEANGAEEKTTETTRKGMNLVLGAKIITQAEGWAQRKGYMVAVAVVKSEKTEQVARFTLKGEFDKLPKFTQAEEMSVDEFLKKEHLDLMVGHRILQNGPNHYYVLGISSYEKGDRDGIYKARARAAYSAECALGGRVESIQVFRETSKPVAEEDYYSYVRGGHSLKERTSYGVRSFESSTSFDPHMRINPLSPRISWYEKSAVSLLTGKDVRIVVAAIDMKELHDFSRSAKNSSNQMKGPEK